MNYVRAQVDGIDRMFDYHNYGFPRDEMADGLDNIPFSNIEIGTLYEYKFRLLPIAYTWGKNHRMKVLISSSNYNRYQVNPNLPIEDGDFFRRKPGDGRSYNYQGVEMYPRVAVQRVAFSQTHQSYIDLPIYTHGGVVASTLDKAPITKIDAFVYPNPATDQISVFLSKNGRYQLSVYSLQGQKIIDQPFINQVSLDVSEWDTGLYIFRITDKSGEVEIVNKVSVQ